MKRQDLAAFVLSVGVAGACSAGGSGTAVELTPLAGLSGSTTWALSPRLINAQGDLAGQASVGQYHAARWMKTGGIEDLHPGGGLLASWAKAINASGVVLGDACIPPPGGNGPCGLYVFRNFPAVGNQQLDISQCTVPSVYSIFPMRLADDGAVAMTLRSDAISGGGDHTVYYRDDLGWIDLSPLVTTDSPPRTRLIDMNSNGQVLIDHSWGGPLIRWSPETGVDVVLQDEAVFAEDMNNHGQVTGSTTFSSGSGAFVFDDESGLVQIDPLGAFPGSRGEIIADSGLVAGYYDDGIFLYSPMSGMQSIEVPGFASIVGLNGGGDLLFKDHHPQTYEVTVKLRLSGGEITTVQELIDPAQTLIIVNDASTINDNREFAVLGSLPGSLSTPVAYRVKLRCAADYDADGLATVPDLFAFLADWFAGSTRADANRDTALDVGDIFAFLSLWFAGC